MVENFDNNNMVCKTGDKGDKVYLILKGSVSVLLPLAGGAGGNAGREQTGRVKMGAWRRVS